MFDVLNWPAVNYIIFLYKETHERELPAWLMHLSFTWPAWEMARLALFKCLGLAQEQSTPAGVTKTCSQVLSFVVFSLFYSI